MVNRVLTKKGVAAGVFCRIVVSLVLVLCLSTVGFCGLTEALEIEVQGGGYVGYATLYPVFEPGETTWQLPFELAIAAENNPSIILAVINELDISYIEDPEVTLGFSVTSGQYATSFSFASPVLSFPTLSNPTADAFGSVSIGSSDVIVGSYPGGKIFRALYNTDGVGAGGTTFANFVTDPPGWELIAPQTISDNLSSIHLKSQFILSANGIASGNSIFTVVPEPATITLLGLGFAAVLKRKRSK